MKVMVEIEVHEGCAECPLFHAGQIFDWCKYPYAGHDAFGRLDMDNYKKRPVWCPLNGCKKVEEEELVKAAVVIQQHCCESSECKTCPFWKDFCVLRDNAPAGWDLSEVKK